jgi:hypothetical protein
MRTRDGLRFVAANGVHQRVEHKGGPSPLVATVAMDVKATPAGVTRQAD